MDEDRRLSYRATEPDSAHLFALVVWLLAAAALYGAAVHVVTGGAWGAGSVIGIGVAWGSHGPYRDGKPTSEWLAAAVAASLIGVGVFGLLHELDLSTTASVAAVAAGVAVGALNHLVAVRRS